MEESDKVKIRDLLSKIVLSVLLIKSLVMEIMQSEAVCLEVFKNQDNKQNLIRILKP